MRKKLEDTKKEVESRKIVERLAVERKECEVERKQKEAESKAKEWEKRKKYRRTD